jgi:hypothetical protein
MRGETHGTSSNDASTDTLCTGGGGGGIGDAPNASAIPASTLFAAVPSSASSSSSSGVPSMLQPAGFDLGAGPNRRRRHTRNCSECGTVRTTLWHGEASTLLCDKCHLNSGATGKSKGGGKGVNKKKRQKKQKVPDKDNAEGWVGLL